MIALEFDGVRDALMNKAAALCNALDARVRQNLSGEVLYTRSGTLANSVSSSIDDDELRVSISTSSIGVPYAAIQEFGGKTAAHDIVAVKSKVLAFSGVGGEIFARRVRHPGSTIPARSYLLSALSDMREGARLAWKQAVVDALDQR